MGGLERREENVVSGSGEGIGRGVEMRVGGGGGGIESGERGSKGRRGRQRKQEVDIRTQRRTAVMIMRERGH